jgi:alkaline phosphatase D
MIEVSQLLDAARKEGRVSRRLFLATGAALAALPQLATQGRAADRAGSFSADPFSLGVASGEPTSDGVVLWTKLAPKPLDPDGGMTPEFVSVRWEVADDEGFQKVVRSGSTLASPQLGHSVHVEVEGLQPGRWYFYRFRAGDATSPVGRTRTAPPADSTPEKLRFAFASCQHYESGYYTAYEHMAKDDLDLVIHLGDYIYENPGRDKQVRKHVGPKLTTLADYRIRHSQYRSDPLLHGMHARCPWLVTWDDHEFENNYANDISERAGVDPIEFLEQRANAYQAYYEMMPLRKQSLPQGPDMKLYRTVGFGRLARFQVLDTRQYRTDQPNGDRASELNADALNPKNTMLGRKQRGWLQAALLQSPATWNVLAQQVMMGMVNIFGGPDQRYSMDQWPGYAYERMKLVEFLQTRRIPNPVVLTGDIHSNWANDLRVDDRDPDLPIVAAEFVGTSISSGGNGSDQSAKGLDAFFKANPCVRFHNRQRGYVRCDVTPSQWKTDYVVVPEVTKPGGPAHVRASFLLEAGKPGLQPA